MNKSGATVYDWPADSCLFRPYLFHLLFNRNEITIAGRGAIPNAVSPVSLPVRPTHLLAISTTNGEGTRARSDTKPGEGPGLTAGSDRCSVAMAGKVAAN